MTMRFGSSSWLSGIMAFLRRRSQDTTTLGTLWQNDVAQEAFLSKEIKSLKDAGPSLRLCVRNHSDEPLLLCWVDQECRPRHFYLLEPTDHDINDPIVEQDRKEKTCLGHAFLIASAKDPQACQQAESLEHATVIGAYRASCIKDSSLKNPVHLLSIQSQTSNNLFTCCLPTLRKRIRQDDWLLGVKEVDVKSKPIDTTNKHYVDAILGGWPVKMEPEWHSGDTQLRQDLEDDLMHATKCLPAHAYQALRSNTPLWINKSLKYGPRTCPIQGKGLCFHVDKSWLVDNGCHVEKAKCVELYDAKHYSKDRNHWGQGGVLLHELSHAYHNKVLPNGYDNDAIIQCYEAAMKEGLYDCVRVKGYQGPECKAYACDNAMEYWAELSTAFLGGTDDSEEYNKWYPFNRKQLKEHDPRAYALLKRLWKVDDR